MVSLLLVLGTISAQTTRPQRTVVVISLDGFPADALDDANLPIPTLRRLAREGAAARAMTAINPTVTWPNHTAMVTGVDARRHGLLVNGTIVHTGKWPPVTVEPWIPKQEMVHAETVYDLAHQAGLTTAQVDWVAIHRAPTITWEFPEVPSAVGELVREMIEKGLISEGGVSEFNKLNIVRRDQIWTGAAVHILREHHPNLLLLHLLSLDSTHHAYGPGTLAATGAMAFLDSCVAQVVEALQRAGLEKNATILVVSDHGFKKVKQQVHLGAALAAARLDDKVYALAEGGMALIYLHPDLSATERTEAQKLLGAIEGVSEVAGPERFEALGLPRPDLDKQMSNWVAVAKPGYAFTGGNSGTIVTGGGASTGSHGYLSSDREMDAIFMAWGAGIRRGAVIERIRNVDVAPTIGALLGLHMRGDIEGHVVREILQ